MPVPRLCNEAALKRKDERVHIARVRIVVDDQSQAPTANAVHLHAPFCTASGTALTRTVPDQATYGLADASPVPVSSPAPAP